MRQQYHFRPSENGFFAWDINRLIQLSASFPIQSIEIDQIAELDQTYWFNTGNKPTCRKIVEHFRLMLAADLQHPIILCAEGKLMDGMHRVTKALAQNVEQITCVRFPSTPLPDYTDVYPDELPYEDDA